MNPIILPQAMGEIVGQTRLFNLEAVEKEFEFRSNVIFLKTDYLSYLGHVRAVWQIYTISQAGARDVMVIVVGNGHGDMSSNPETDCISHSINTPGKGMNPIILPQAMGKIVRQTRLFNLGAATCLEEGKLNLNL